MIFSWDSLLIGRRSLSCLRLILMFFALVKVLAKNCEPSNGTEFLSFLCDNSYSICDSIILKSEERYHIPSTLKVCNITSTLIITTNDIMPAIMFLGTTSSEQGLINGGNITINNVKIKGGNQRRGNLFHNSISILVKNCEISDYMISTYGNSFINFGGIVDLYNTSFQNNTISAIESSSNLPPNIISTANINWKLSVDSCSFINNHIISPDNGRTSSVNLFFNVWGFYECTDTDICNDNIDNIYQLMFNNNLFLGNKVSGIGAAFIWIATSLQSRKAPQNFFQITNNSMFENHVTGAYSFCDLDFGLWCPSFFLISGFYRWMIFNSNVEITRNTFTNNNITTGSNFFSFERISGQIQIKNSLFDQNDLSGGFSTFFFFTGLTGPVKLLNSLFRNSSLHSSSFMYLDNCSGSVKIKGFSFSNITISGEASVANLISFVYPSAQVQIEYCIFENIVSQLASLIYIRIPIASITLTNLLFRNISAQDATLINVIDANTMVRFEYSSIENLIISNSTTFYLDGNIGNGQHSISYVNFSNIVATENCFYDIATGWYYPSLMGIADDCEIINCRFNSIQSHVSTMFILASNTSMTDCNFKNIQISEENHAIISLDSSTLDIIGASFEQITTRYVIYNMIDSTILDCTYDVNSNSPITNNMNYTCTEESDPTSNGSKCKGLVCLNKTDYTIIILTAFFAISLLLNIYTQRNKIIEFYGRYKKKLEKKRRAYMRENQLKALISRYGNENENGELDSIENVLQTTLPDIIVPFNKIKLDGGLIGKGGSGIVMKGRLGHQTTIAIKLIQSQLAGELEGLQDLQAELSMLYSINHPNIVRFMGISFHNKAILILQEYCQMHLGEYVEKNGIFHEMDPFLDKFLIIVDTVVFLHEKNIVHRDLKPENILLDEKFTPKICDLGMAKFVSQGSQTYKTQGEGRLFGSIGYTPPEVVAIKKGDKYNPKGWDIFSMAMIIYFMWSGKPPLFEFDNGFAVNYEISRGTRPLLPLSMPEKIRDLVREMWDQDFRKRPSSEEIYDKFYAFHSSMIKDHTTIEEGSHIQLNPLTDLAL